MSATLTIAAGSLPVGAVRWDDQGDHWPGEPAPSTFEMSCRCGYRGPIEDFFHVPGDTCWSSLVCIDCWMQMGEGRP